jgi:hypothetical protein
VHSPLPPLPPSRLCSLPQPTGSQFALRRRSTRCTAETSCACERPHPPQGGCSRCCCMPLHCFAPSCRHVALSPLPNAWPGSSFFQLCSVSLGRASVARLQLPSRVPLPGSQVKPAAGNSTRASGSSVVPCNSLLLNHLGAQVGSGVGGGGCRGRGSIRAMQCNWGSWVVAPKFLAHPGCTSSHLSVGVNLSRHRGEKQPGRHGGRARTLRCLMAHNLFAALPMPILASSCAPSSLGFLLQPSSCGRSGRALASWGFRRRTQPPAVPGGL